MIKIYNENNIYLDSADVDNLKMEREISLPPMISFDVHKELGKIFRLEGTIETEEGKFLIKEKLQSRERLSYICKPDFSELQRELITKDYSTMKAETIVGDLLSPISQWRYIVQGDIKRSVKINAMNRYEAIYQVADAFKYEIFFDIKNKTILMAESIGKRLGEIYVHDEVNLIDLNTSADSYDVYTRIIPVGKDGLTIKEVNGGRDYIDNFQYVSKIKPLLWKDERYTDAESLKVDAVKKLLDLSKPRQSFEVNILDLYRQDKKQWPFLEYQVGDYIDLISSRDDVDTKQRIVKTITDLNNDSGDHKIVIANLARNYLSEISDDTKLLQEAMDEIDAIIEEVAEDLTVDFNDKFKAIGDMVRGNNGGFVIDRFNEQGQKYEILVTDNMNITDAINVIRINKTGVAFSTNGFDGPFNVAITIDGKIAGKYIIVDALETITANLGTVKAGRIQDKDNESYWDLNKKEIVLNVESLKIKNEDVATKSNLDFTKEGLEARFEQIGGENLIPYSEDLSNRWVLYEGAAFATNYPKIDTVAEWGAEDAWRIRTRADGTSAIKAYMNLMGDMEMMRGKPFTLSVYAKNNRTDQPVTIGSNRFGSVTLEANEIKRVIISGANNLERFIQLQLSARGSGYYLDVTLWHPKLETGWVATDWVEKLITGITKIDKDGATFGREGETIETNVAYNGMSIKDGIESVASFGDRGAVMPKATIGELETDDAVLTYGNRSTNTYDVKSGSYESVTEVLEAIFPNNNRVHIIGDPVIRINVHESISDNIVLKGIGGNGRIYIWLYDGVTINGHIWARDCKCRVYIGSISNTNRGKVKNTTNGMTEAQARTIWNESSSFLRVGNVDVDANGKDYGIVGNDSGVTVAQNADVVAAKYALFSASGHSVRNVGSRGNAQYGLYAHNGGDIHTVGTVPKGSISSLKADNGYMIEQGTANPTDSTFIKPPTVSKTFSTVIKKAKLDTLNYTTGYMATSYYGANAAQGRYTGMTGWMEGQITFDKTVPNYWEGATSKTVQMRLHRKNTSHGQSAAVKPKPNNFTASWGTGAIRGGWTSWATVPASLFNEGGNTLLKFRGTVLDSDYAIWDDAEVKITITKDV